MNAVKLASLATLLALGSASAQSVTLQFWSMWNQQEPQAKVLQQAVADYQAANPNVKVNVNWAGRDLRKLVIPALSSGQSIDIVENGTDWLLGEGRATYWLPLNKYLLKPSVGDNGKTVSQVLIRPLVEQSRLKGQLLAIPHQPFAVLYLYNKAAFAKAGITKEPSSWAEFTADLKALRGAGFTPITVDQDAYTDVNFAYAALRAVGSCPAVQRLIGDKSGRSWQAPEILSMAKDISGLWSAGDYARDMPGSRYPAGQQRVGLGEVALNLNGTWLPEEIKATSGPDFQWGSFSYPRQTGGKGGTDAVMMGSQGLAIVAKSKYPDQAFDFIRYVISKKSQEAFVKQAAAASSRLDVAWPATLQEARNVVLNSKTAAGWACDIQGEVVNNVVLPAFRDLMNGKLSAPDYVKRMTSESAKFWSTRK